MRDPALWYDRAGLPIDIHEWSRLHSIEDYIRVGSTDVGPYWVSTVWLGIDHRFYGEGPPVIFETMVFAKEDRGTGSLPDLDCRRYCTESEALAGHQETVLLVEATLQEIPDHVEETNGNGLD